METWNKRLEQAMDARGKNQADLVKVTKKAAPSVSGWITGSTKMMDGENVAIVCAYLGINPMWLFFGAGESGLEVKPMAAQELAKYLPKDDDPFREQLNYFYENMKDEHKDVLVMLAQKLHNIDVKDDKVSNPFPNKPKKEKAK